LTPPGKIRIGISGWTYPPWRGTFYPEKLAQHQELPYASGIFRSIEINGTFYSLQKPESFAKWAEATPENFVFSVKAPRYITHIQRLKEAKVPLANFLASGILRLGPKLGPIFWQLPPNFKFDPKRLEAFFKLLPPDVQAAAKMARRHDQWMKQRAWMKTKEQGPLRHSLEVRHASFAVAEFIELLRKYNVALVCADTKEWPRMMDVTSDFLYCRLHGSEARYAGGYDDEALDEWAARVITWAQGQEPAGAERVIPKDGPKLDSRDVFVYFDNETKVRSPVDAQRLMERVEQSWPAAVNRHTPTRAR
jgi:uncharacterized protein YecE (DUF72 family)